MKITIVVPAYNEERLLPSSLVAIRDASQVFLDRRWEVELIVCDNNSNDRTAELARAAGASVVFEPRNQIARARNTGAAAATGDWLLFVDADSRPTVELFRVVAEAMSGGKYLAGGATLKFDEGTRLSWLFERLWLSWSRLAKHMAGAFIFCETAAFRTIGGFSEEFYAGEEIDLSQRLKEVARTSNRDLLIIKDPPLITSGRKTRLYSTWEVLAFMIRAAFRPKRVLQNREACGIWYDGRR